MVGLPLNPKYVSPYCKRVKVMRVEQDSVGLPHSTSLPAPSPLWG